MINVILVDDEPHVCEICTHLLNRLPSINISAVCYNIDDAYDAISKLKPDLVLTDIQLKKGTGFDLLNRFEQPTFEVIIITSYDEYAIRAIKAGAIDYLLKPIDELEFFEAIEKASKKTAVKAFQVETASKSYNGELNKIVLNTHEGSILVNYENLIYCKSDGGYTTFYLSTDKPIIISKVLKYYEGILPENVFVRTHQSYLVNINYVNKLNNRNTIILLNGEEIPVSQRKAKEIRQRLKY